MNVKPIQGNTNLETLIAILDGDDLVNVEGLEEQCAYLAAGINGAKVKIRNAVDKQRAAKYILRRRNHHPEHVVKLAIKAKEDGAFEELTASQDRDRFVHSYRQMRALIYVNKSVKLLLAKQQGA